MAEGKGGRTRNGFRTNAHATEDRAQEDRGDYKMRTAKSRRFHENLVPEGFLTLDGDEEYLLPPARRRQYIDDPVHGRGRDVFSVTVDPAEIQQSAIVVHALAENAQLRQKVKELKQHLMNSKLETAELYKKFGSLADNWQQTVNELKATLEDQQVSYEERISGLEKTNKQLKEENEELRTMVKELYAKLDELKGQERQLKIGQIGFALEELVAEILFPGKSRAEKRQRYGVELKNVKKKVGKIEDDDLKHEAQARLATIPPELFEPWVVGIIGDIKKMRLSPAHPPLGSYDEITGEIRILYKDDQYKCEDLITVVNHLKNLYDKQKLPFGGEPGDATA